MSAPVLAGSGVGVDRRGPAGIVRVLDAVDVVADRGELVVVRGSSGSGKTSLLRVLGGLDRPTRGSVSVDGVDLGSAREPELLALRRDRVASVFQDFRLLDVLTAAENVEVPLRVRRTPADERDERVRAALSAVRLDGHGEQFPTELSGGQQQRVGIARAVVGAPGLLLADEPTAQLDSVTAAGIVTLVADLVAGRGLAAVVTTSDDAFLDRATRVVDLPDR